MRVEDLTRREFVIGALAAPFAINFIRQPKVYPVLGVLGCNDTTSSGLLYEVAQLAPNWERAHPGHVLRFTLVPYAYPDNPGKDATELGRIAKSLKQGVNAAGFSLGVRKILLALDLDENLSFNSIAAAAGRRPNHSPEELRILQEERPAIWRWYEKELAAGRIKARTQDKLVTTASDDDGMISAKDSEALAILLGGTYIPQVGLGHFDKPGAAQAFLEIIGNLVLSNS